MLNAHAASIKLIEQQFDEDPFFILESISYTFIRLIYIFGQYILGWFIEMSLYLFNTRY